MKVWQGPQIPPTEPHGLELVLNERGQGPRTVSVTDGEASLYVCGITPYDATHMGHANTYVFMDLLVRFWLAAGHRVNYVQNVTDVDDPLLERATATGVDWRELAREQTELFHGDMRQLRVVAPTGYVGAVESIPLVVEAVERLVAADHAYPLTTPDGHIDYYADLGADGEFAAGQALAGENLEALFSGHGGNPDLEGKRGRLDPLLWRAKREGEPWWEGASLGEGRPGWHIECASICARYVGASVTVLGGGTDLYFPHHEMSCSHQRMAYGSNRPASHRVNTAMVSYQGEKMSKSLGNLVKVSELVAAGEDPAAIRLAILSNHYRQDWEWYPSILEAATSRLTAWQRAARASTALGSGDGGEYVDGGEYGQNGEALESGRAWVGRIAGALANDLDSPAALRVVDQWASAGAPGAGTVIPAIDALLGVKLA